MALSPEPAPARTLVVDDDPSVLVLAQELLASEGHEVITCGSGELAVRSLERQPFDLVVADLGMPGMDGFQLLQEVQEKWPETPVIFLTGDTEVSRAVAAIKHGAEDYVTKPFDVDQLIVSVNKALETKRLKEDNQRLRRMVFEQRGSFGTLIGASQPMQVLYGQLEKVAPTGSAVLLLGESGTGKELTAKEIHRRSERAHQPFVPVNCGALPADILESELFGHVKGAFTGASASKVGLFEAAHGGTIFLDEIGTTNEETQKSLLRVLEEKQIRRVGDTELRPVDVRIVSATNANLDDDMRTGAFRSDLYFRLSRVIVRVPPLRQRGGDIEVLAEHFLERACRRQGKSSFSISKRAVERLLRHNWPGNVRELENVIERAVIFARRGILGPVDLDIEASTDDPGPTDDLSLESVVRTHISTVLGKCGGNKLQAAKVLGIPRTSLYKRLKRHGLS